MFSLARPTPHAAPLVDSLSPSTSIATTGAVILTISGKNFLQPGCLPGTVQIGGGACPAVAGSSWTNRQIQCTVPAGTGAALPLSVTTRACNSSTGQNVGGLESRSFPFSYTPPSITGFSPTTCPAAGA